jgi:leader peptidase (prepilin peptidase)/N-methyltransferase
MTLWGIVLGWLVGVVLNALADDLPGKVRLPHDSKGRRRLPVAWSGVVAFLTKNRASSRAEKLGWRYPLLEILTALLYGLITAKFPLNLQLVFFLAYVALLLLIAVIDLERREILAVVLIVGGTLALAEVFITDRLPPAEALIGAGIGLGAALIIYGGGLIFSWVAALLRGQPLSADAFGFGDVLLAGLCGLILGRPVIFGMGIFLVLSSVGTILYMVLRIVKGEKTSAIPQGPYLVAATLIMLVWSDEIRALILQSLPG